jgi:hypothetical protein
VRVKTSCLYVLVTFKLVHGAIIESDDPPCYRFQSD